ncbi:Hypothetical protein NTJ_05342 [Nesidiocoris tenuis]|uniref:Uncharacterized protein n=1 Tax=Nesidiocoris tenuis TaxID=355587 RepID=A0ABN7AJV0_9HEMI|nr:Hypothetical protein NTJ_05342 [Nesidiocoris tenuis]
MQARKRKAFCHEAVQLVNNRERWTAVVLMSPFGLEPLAPGVIGNRVIDGCALALTHKLTNVITVNIVSCSCLDILPASICKGRLQKASLFSTPPPLHTLEHLQS